KVLCLRHIPEFVRDRGDRAETVRLFREAIETGEKYLEQEPNDLGARVQLCWCCADLAIELVAEKDGQIGLILDAGVRHATIALQQRPRSLEARYVSAWLKILLGEYYCTTGRRQDAVLLFREGIPLVQSICEESPTTDYYWGGVRWTHDRVLVLGKSAEQTALVHQMYEWIRDVSPCVPEEPQPQSNLL